MVEFENEITITSRANSSHTVFLFGNYLSSEVIRALSFVFVCTLPGPQSRPTTTDIQPALAQ